MSEHFADFDINTSVAYQRYTSDFYVLKIDM